MFQKVLPEVGKHSVNILVNFDKKLTKIFTLYLLLEWHIVTLLNKIQRFAYLMSVIKAFLLCIFKSKHVIKI